jgi:hypothetical protein
MQIRIPKLIFKYYDRFEEWGNKLLFGIRRIDYILAVSLVLGTGWTYFREGLFAAIEVAALFGFIVICCLWIF